MLLDTGKCGSLRDIEMTDMRSILDFLIEYPEYQKEQKNVGERRKMAYADQVDWL